MADLGRNWKTTTAGLILAFALVMFGIKIYQLNNQETLITIATLPPDENRTVTIFVGGAVANPGVYTLTGDVRIESAIAAAGGFGPDADQNGINRALRLRDEDQLIIPRKGDPTATAARPAAIVPTAAAATPLAIAPTAGGTAPAVGGRINVNSATVDELARLPGVGAKIAQEIVDYRTQNGPFAGPGDLAKVKGISDRMVAGWSDLITFGP